MRNFLLWNEKKQKENVNFVLLLFFKNRAFTSGKLMHEFPQPRKQSLELGFLEYSRYPNAPGNN